MMHRLILYFYFQVTFLFKEMIIFYCHCYASAWGCNKAKTEES